MAYPTDLDSFTDPISTDPLDNPAHATLHTNKHTAIEALEAKVGVNSSTVSTSHDYKLNRGSISITVPDGQNTTGIAITQNDTTNNPNTMVITNAGNGYALSIDNNGTGTSLYIDAEATSEPIVNIVADVLTSGNVIRAYSNSAGFTSAYGAGYFAVANASASGVGVRIDNAGTGNGLFIDQNGNGTAINIDSESTSSSVVNIDTVCTTNILRITPAGVIGSGYSAINIYTNSALTAGGNLLELYSDNGSSTDNIQRIFNDGSGIGLFIDSNNIGDSINIDADANSASNMIGINMNIANAGAGLEYAFGFGGSEAVAGAVGATQDQKIRIKIGATDYFIPCHTT